MKRRKIDDSQRFFFSSSSFPKGVGNWFVLFAVGVGGLAARVGERKEGGGRNLNRVFSARVVLAI